MSSATCACTDESHAPSLGNCGRLPKSIQDHLDRFELLAEMWVTVGIAAPIFLAILVTVMEVMSNGAPLGGWLAPLFAAICVGGVLAGVELVGHPLQQNADADDAVRAAIRSQVQMLGCVAFVSGVIAVFVLGMLDAAFLTKMADLPASSGINVNAATTLEDPLYATMLIQSGGSGLIAGAMLDSSFTRRVSYSVAFVAVAGALIVF